MRFAPTCLIGITAMLAMGSPGHAQASASVGTAFDGADLNHDGQISRAEFVAARQQRFDRLDRNHDGVISNADFPRGARNGRRWTRIDASIAVADANHDGVITREELAHAPTPIFDQADTNRDGYVSRAEADVARQAAKARLGR